ncbi:MAG TPA: hypothetical protein VF221_13425, partial [Chloroflexota bacterium]
LAGRWLEMLDALEQSRCAHGDLQHGNVLITGGEIKLVDYDCMFVPALRGKSSHELGHQNFQHPGRSPSDFGPHLDRFSAWVIYLSLHAVRTDPGLWQASGAGDECLLLRRKDFLNPARSAELQILANHPDAMLRSLSTRFRASLDGNLRDVPPVRDESTARRSSETQLSSRALAPTWWLQFWQNLAPSVPPAESRPEPPDPGRHPEWILGHLAAEQAHASAHFRPSGGVRVVALVFLLLPAGFLPAALLLTISVALAIPAAVFTVVMANAILAVTAYRRDPLVAELVPLVRTETAHVRRQASIARTVQSLQRRRDRISDEEVREHARLAIRRDKLQECANRERAAIEEALERKVQHVGARLRELDSREQEEIHVALADAQAVYVDDALHAASLRAASIRGVGWSLKLRLWASGVWSAADVTSERIRGLQGLPREELTSLVGWRVDIERHARKTMPRDVSTKVKQRLRDRYALERSRLLDERDSVEASAREAIALLDERHRRDLEGIEQEVASAAASRAARREALEERIRDVCAEEPGVQEALDAVRRELCRFRGVTFPAFLATTYFWWLRGSARAGR